MISPIFRVFEAAKPERSRKLNVDPRHRFDPFSDSLMDYGSIIGHRLKKPWQLFNRLISVHVPYCPNRCWHCYLPKELFTMSTDARDRWKYCSGEEIVRSFLDQRQADHRNDKKSNVLRITGGEPFLLPELIYECLKVLKKEGLEEEVFLWTETNLLPFVGRSGQAFMDRTHEKEILTELASFGNLAVHPCFHGLDANEFDDITGTKFSVTLEDQLAGVKRLTDAKISVYPTFGSNVCNPSNVQRLFDGLKAVAPDLPLKTALVRYDTDYEPIRERMKRCRPYPHLYFHYSALRIWNQLLLEHYGVGYGVLPRHIADANRVPLYEKVGSAAPAPSARKEIIWLFKSSFRDLYHREILDYLAYPYNHVIEITYEKRHIQDDLFLHMSQLPATYEGRSAIWCYADDPHKTRFPFQIANLKGQ